jgi:hypothetical protein
MEYQRWLSNFTMVTGIPLPGQVEHECSFNPFNDFYGFKKAGFGWFPD